MEYLVWLDDDSPDSFLHGNFNLGDVRARTLEEPLTAGSSLFSSILEVKNSAQAQSRVSSNNGKRSDVLLQHLACKRLSKLSK